MLVPGSTPERRAAWNSLSDQQKQQVTTLFQQHLNQAAADLKAKKPASSTPLQFSVPLDGVRLPFKSQGNDLLNATIAYYDENGKRHLIPSATPDKPESAPIASVLPRTPDSKLIYAPLPHKTNNSGWHRLNAIYVPGADRNPLLLLTAALGQSGGGGGTPSSGTITASGNEQSTGGNPGSATVTIGGAEQATWDCENAPAGSAQKPVSPLEPCCNCIRLYDNGSVSISVNGFVQTAWYESGSTTATIAAALVNAFNGAPGSPVTASLSGSTVTLIAKAGGAGSNYPLSTTVSYDNGDFSRPSFSTTQSGPTLTGGSGGSVYDSGTVTATINGHVASVTWGQSSTPQSIASDLASAITSSSAGTIQATSSGNVVSLSSTDTGTGTNWPISVTTTFDSADFATASFTFVASGMSGGSSGSGADSDGDGIPDDLEAQLADAFTPAYHVSANENAGTGFATFQDSVPMTVQTVNGSTPPISYYRVEPSDYIDAQYDPNSGQYVYHRYFRIDYLTLWNEDDGLVGSITCPLDVGWTLAYAVSWMSAFYGADLSALTTGLGGHPLDNEHSAVLLAVQVGGPSDMTIPLDYTQYSAVRYFAAAHEHTVTDRSSVFTPSSPLPTNTHVEMYLSRSKHSTYFTNPDWAPILPDSIIAATESAISAYWYFEQWWVDYTYYDWCPVDEYYYVVAPDGEIFYVWYYYDGSCDVPDIEWDPVQLLAELYLADTIFYDCLGEHFTDQGISYASTRINVGEPADPTSGNHFIQDNTDDHVGTKLTEPIFPDKHL